jgi:hypothetical protein
MQDDSMLREFSKIFFSVPSIVDRWQCVFYRQKNQLTEHHGNKSAVKDYTARSFLIFRLENIALTILLHNCFQGHFT